MHQQQTAMENESEKKIMRSPRSSRGGGVRDGKTRGGGGKGGEGYMRSGLVGKVMGADHHGAYSGA
jgi:hypothetical protein